MAQDLICRQARICGACEWLSVPYPEQLARKRAHLGELFEGRIAPDEVIGMEDPTHYRNKLIVPYASTRAGRVIYGMYRAGTHRIVSCEGCLVNTQRSLAIAADIAQMLPSLRIAPYDEDRQRGWLRHVLIREGFSSGECMVTLIAASDDFPRVKPFVSRLRQRHPDITTIVMNVNPRVTNVVLGERERNLYGRGWISDELCGCTFKISSRSFFQTNPVQTERLYDAAIRMADPEGGTILDAYCGVGTIGIIAAKRTGCALIGVESSKDAVRDARGNARYNGISNATFVAGDAGEYADELARRGEGVDVVFLDPPRSGASARFIGQASRLGPARIVYISCNPTTQVRDIALFEQAGYHLEQLEAFDLFPHTSHVETVVLLSRRSS